MTGEKVKSVLQQYFKGLTAAYPTVEPAQMLEVATRCKAPALTRGLRVAHLKFMCLEAQKLVDEGRIEKAMRWLGFLQGVLWEGGVSTLDTLKNDSRPETPA